MSSRTKRRKEIWTNLYTYWVSNWDVLNPCKELSKKPIESNFQKIQSKTCSNTRTWKNKPQNRYDYRSFNLSIILLKRMGSCWSKSFDHAFENAATMKAAIRNVTGTIKNTLSIIVWRYRSPRDLDVHYELSYK